MGENFYKSYYQIKELYLDYTKNFYNSNNPVGKMGKDSEQTFFKGVILRACEHMNMYSLLALWELQIKTTMWWHFTLRGL